MGLLSDPEYGSVKWVRVLRKLHSPLGFLCYFCALGWFVMLGNKQFNNETYFSENALLPGLVTNEFSGEPAAKQYLNEFIQELEDKYMDTDKMPVPWLVGKMSQIGLEVYTHNFTLNYPLGMGQKFKGVNVYGILRAARTSPLEALVVSAPFRPLSSHQKGTAAGIALMLAFAEFARPQKYWAKDIIFLITQHEQLGMQAWLEAYHGITGDSATFKQSLGSFLPPGDSILDLERYLNLERKFEKCLDPGVLRGRSGSIQAAVNLEFHTQKIKYVEVKIEGLNGQLPNLDFPNLVHKLLVKSGVYHSFKNHYSWIRSRNKMDEWVNNLSTMMSMLVTQVAGVPNGNHGLFHRFGIEAVTLEGRDANDPAGVPPKVASLGTASFYRLGVALESILRSLNNLLERFHQSYFFYLMAAIHRFVSIGQYMPSLCLLCGAMLIRAIALWVDIQTDENTDKQKKSDTVEKDKTSDLDTDGEGEKRKEKVEKKKKQKQFRVHKESSTSLINIGLQYLTVHGVGFAVMQSPVLFNYIGITYYKLQSEMSLYYGLIITSVIITIISPFIFRTVTREEGTLLNVLVLVELATICLSVGMHNFSLGLCLATVYTPLALVVSVAKNEGKLRTISLNLKRLFCLMLHPLSVVTVSMIAYSVFLYPDESFISSAGRGRDAAMQAIMFALTDSMIYGNWLFNVLTTLVLPTWIIFWKLLCFRVKDN